MSRATVCQFREPGLHYLSHRREVRSIEVIPASEEFSHEVRSLSSSEDGRRELRNVSSIFARRRGYVDTGGIQRACDLLSMSYAAGEIRRSRYFFVRHLSSVGRILSNAGVRAGIPR
jgi:hypothetical protein